MDPGFGRVVASGVQRACRTGLRPGTTYFYRFSRRGEVSEVSRTRTWPEGPERVRAAVVVVTRVAEAGFLRANFVCQYLDWVDHGYGIVDVTRERVVAELWWQDKRTPDSADVLGQQLVVWGEEDGSATPPRFPHQIDPVSHHGFAVRPTPRADL